MESNPRAAIAVKRMEAQLMPEFCSRDVVTISAVFGRVNTGEPRRIVVSSAYFPHEEGGSLPSQSVVKLVDYCRREGFPLVLGCDANAHHEVWDSSDTNDRDRRLLEYLATTDLEHSIYSSATLPILCWLKLSAHALAK